MSLDKSLSCSAVFLLASLVGAGCSGSGVDPGEPTADPAVEGSDALIAGRAGAVFVMTNDASSNEVLAYRRASNGTLQRAASYATSGKGSGDGLGSQGALTFSADRQWLFAVNAGSNELSVFRVNGEALYLVDAIATGGVRPVSVTESYGLIYVLHAGDLHNDVTGFVQRFDGSLARLPGSTRALSGASVGPAQVSFSPSGRALIVTEKATNIIDEFRVHPLTGLLGQATQHASKGQTPFGFAITNRGQVVVSEAFGGTDDASALSSYQLGASSGLVSVSASVPSTESAACWVALAKADRLAYVTNTKSGTISAYGVTTGGALALIGDGRAADTGAGSKPTDVALSKGDGFLYALESGTQSIGVLRVGGSGGLTVMPDVTGLPVGAAGLVAQ